MRERSLLKAQLLGEVGVAGGGGLPAQIIGVFGTVSHILIVTWVCSAMPIYSPESQTLGMHQ